MIRFLDTSALIKLYIAEHGSQRLVEWLADSAVAVSQLTYGEVFATFARRRREHLVSDEEHTRLCTAFEHDWGGFFRLHFSDAALSHVPGLCHRHPLRGADALQLACATLLRDEGLELILATSDRQLLTAAKAEGLQVFDPEVA